MGQACQAWDPWSTSPSTGIRALRRSRSVCGGWMPERADTDTAANGLGADSCEVRESATDSHTLRITTRSPALLASKLHEAGRFLQQCRSPLHVGQARGQGALGEV